MHVLGRRAHEYHLGLAVLGAVLAGRAAGLWGDSPAVALAAAAGAWLFLKDWRDLIPSQRDTASWRLGVHRRAAPLRAIRRADGLPALAGAIAFSVGLVNLLSALTPNIAWRHHLLLRLEPVEAVPLFHTLAVPASVALVVTAFHLRMRRRRALHAAVALLVVLGALSLLKGLDFEEAILSWAAAGLLWWGRGAFCVRHGPLRAQRRMLVLVALGGVATLAAALTGVDAARETAALLAWTKGSVDFRDELAWVPLMTGLTSLLAIVALAYAVFRPLEAPRALPNAAERRTALRLVRTHGRDTLAFFKLRRDVQYLFGAGGRAFLGYRLEHNVMLIAGDPVGPPEALPELVRDACAFAEIRGLRIGVLGASDALLPLWRQAGLRSLYIGDEGIVETGRFSLEGRAIRKVRQAVARIEKAGYTAALAELELLDEGTLGELEHVSALWRAGAPERGFSMAMDSLRSEQHGSVVVVARDAEGAVRGFLHFVPTYERAAMSLSYMRRDRETPNGLIEFLIVRSIELAGRRGVEELSLNFAAFGRLLERPSTRFERLLGWTVSLGNPFFQIESLHRFNAKFAPRWEPRYLLFEGVLGLPRVGIAALRVEGQLPRLRS